MFQKSVNREIKSKQYQYLTESYKIWLETIGYHPNTVKLNYRNTQEFLSWLEKQGIMQLKDFKTELIQKYQDYLQHRTNCMKGGSLSTGYINKHISALRLFSKYLQQSQKANIIIKPELLKTKESAKCLTQNEIQLLYKAAGDEMNLYNQRDTAMLDVFYGCGLRASEGAALNISDILFEKSLLYVRKGKGYRERYVPINKQVKTNLQEYILNQRNDLLNGNKNEALLLSRKGQRWSKQGIYNRLQLLKNNTNNQKLQQQTFGLHILRHSIATHILQSGMKLEYISRFLGHKSLETTQRYTHIEIRI